MSIEGIGRSGAEEARRKIAAARLARGVSGSAGGGLGAGGSSAGGGVLANVAGPGNSANTQAPGVSQGGGKLQVGSIDGSKKDTQGGSAQDSSGTDAIA
jgi:hypothetical protein